MMRWNRLWGIATAACLGWQTGTCFASVTSFDDIQFWTGAGPNRAALVIDWLGIPELPPLAWGYRWTGSATGEQMLRDVVQADPRFFARLGTPGPFGTPLYGIGYDRDGDGFALDDGTVFVDGIAVTGPADGAVSTDRDDSYNEGWNLGFWAYYTGGGNPYDGGIWQPAMTGFSDRLLNNGDWDGFSFAPDFVGDAPAAANAAPHTTAGDFNGDGQWDCTDIDALTAEIVAGDNDPIYDMNGDGIVDPADVADPAKGWLAVGGANNVAQTGGNSFLPGDADLSGSVDGSDFSTWNSHQFTAGAAWCRGDFDANGAIDGTDFGIWNAHKFQSSDRAFAVPEPIVGLELLAGLALGLALGRYTR